LAITLLKEILELLHSQLAVLGVVDVRVCHDLQKRHAHTVIVYQCVVFEVVETLG
jgi:hypothetical protein